MDIHYLLFCVIVLQNHVESWLFKIKYFRFYRFTGLEGPSGFGFELTFRLKREPGETAPPTWPAELMQGLARYVFQSGTKLVYHIRLSTACVLTLFSLECYQFQLIAPNLGKGGLNHMSSATSPLNHLWRIAQRGISMNFTKENTMTVFVCWEGKQVIQNVLMENAPYLCNISV